MSGIALPLSFGATLAAAGVLGLVVGSFLNVVIHRLPKMLERQWLADAAAVRGEPEPVAKRFNLAQPASHCPGCGHCLRIVELIPLVSWLSQRGRCTACQTPIALRYPLIEALTGGLFMVCAWRFDDPLQALAAMLLGATLIAASAIDLETRLLPDALTLPLLWSGLLANLGGLFCAIDSAVIGAASGYLSLWTIHHAFRLLTGREGMGHGDFKLLAALGAWLGLSALPAIVLLASAGGAALGLLMMRTGRLTRDQPIAFGPWLAASGLLVLFAHDALAAWLALA